MYSPPPELLAAFSEIQQPRSRFALEHFVVGSKFTPEAQYSQCVLEAQNKWDSIRLGRLEMERIDLTIAAIHTPGRLGEIEREKLAIEREQVERAMLGAERELECLCSIFSEFSKKYTHDQIEEAQAGEQQQRLFVQAIQDWQAFGYVTPGNSDALRMIGATLDVRHVEGKVQFSIDQAEPVKRIAK